jgi:hypothetical protein
MVKNFLVSIFMLLAIHGFAQEGTASPYSFYGIGEVKFKGTVENKAMGGLGILPDSIHINIQNPASLASLKLTSFSLASTFNSNKLSTSAASESAQRFTFDYFVMAFPTGKIGLSLGIMPYSSVGYKVKQNDDLTASRYSGSGGLNKVFVGAGYKITPKFSAGLDFSYNFGKIETSASKYQNLQYGTREINSSELAGINLNAGLLFQTKIKKLNFVASTTFTPSSILKTVNTRELALVNINSNDVEVLRAEPQVVEVPNSKLQIPSKVAFGAGIGKATKWFLGFETTFQGAAGFSSLYATPSNASFETASKVSIGGYYVPNYNSYSNYLKRITYRAGLRYENIGLVINSESIKDTAFTFGLGMPVSGSLSNLNFGFEIGQRGTTSVNLIQENYFNVSIGLSFNDRWFIKRKYD